MVVCPCLYQRSWIGHSFLLHFSREEIWQNYIQRCEAGATMAMQPRAWMTSYLFDA
jgi:hypothetical protein